MDVDSENHLAGNETDDSDPAFTAFQEQLSNKRGKGKAPVARKKVEEVGPSGQTWTPLERQV
jgi:hypothetical protein